MLSVKTILVSAAFPTGTWAAWTELSQSHLVIGMLCAVLLSFGIFLTLMWATEVDAFTWPSTGRHRRYASLPLRKYGSNHHRAPTRSRGTFNARLAKL